MAKHFLIAEDDEDDLELYKEAIIQAALPIKLTSVIYCDRIFEEVVVEPLPDVIIVDGNLRDKPLLQCIKDIRSHKKLGNLPLVVLTGSNHSATKADSYKAGISLYLEKPNNFEIMLDIFKRLYHINWDAYRSMTSEDFFSVVLR